MRTMTPQTARRALGAAATVVMLGTLAVATSAEAAPGEGSGTIIVNKRTTGGDGAFLFGLTTAAGTPAVPPRAVSTFQGAGTTEFTDLAPGTYNLVEVAPGWSTVSADCGGPSPSGLVVSSGETITCTFTNEPMISVAKAVTTAPRLVAGTTNEFDIGYTVTLGNNTDSRLEVELGDVLAPVAGIVVLSAELDSVPAGFVADAAWSATATAAGLSVGSVVLEGGQSMALPMTLRVQVDATVATAATRNCVREGTEGLRTGAMNIALATFSVNDQQTGSVVAYACAPLSTLTLVAQVTNDNGGTLTPAAITLQALDAGTPVLSGTAAVAGAVDASPLTLSGSDATGYTKSAFTCVGGSLAGNVVTVADGTDATCTVRYDDDPPAATTTTTTTTTPVAVAAAQVAPTTVASTLPRTGSSAVGSAGISLALLGAGGLLLLVAGVRRRSAPPAS